MSRISVSLMGLAISLPRPVKSSLKRIRNGANRIACKCARAWGGKKSVPAFWADALNFGDLLTPALLKSYGVMPVWTECCARGGRAPDSTLVSCGSVLGWVSADFSGYVLGTGLHILQEAKHMPHAKFLGVRGALTRSAMGLSSDLALGDPGLLAERLVKRETIKKKWTLGIVPNQSEADGETMRALRMQAQRTGMRCKIINPKRLPVSVIEDICACECIAASSLHGLVVADAFAIPNVRAHFDEKMSDFKFQDYYSSFDEELVTVDGGGGGIQVD